MPSLEQLYQQVIFGHTRARHGLGTAKGVGASNRQANLIRGDEVTLGVQLTPDGAVERIVWDGDDYSISQASLSVFAELVDEQPSIDRVTRAYGVIERMMYSRNRGVSEEAPDLFGGAVALESTFQFADRAKYALLGWYAPRDALAKLGIDIAGDRA